MDQHCKTQRTTVQGKEEYVDAKLMVAKTKEKKKTGEHNDCCLS